MPSIPCTGTKCPICAHLPYSRRHVTIHKLTTEKYIELTDDRPKTSRFFREFRAAFLTCKPSGNAHQRRKQRRAQAKNV